MKNIIKVVVMSLMLVVVMVTTYLFLDKKDLGKTESNLMYKITYNDDTTPENTYNIDLYNDKVMLEKISLCSAIDCSPKTEEVKDLRYSKSNLEKLIRFVKNNFQINNSYTIDIDNKSLDEYQENVLNSLTLSEKFFEVAVEKYKYRFEYSYSDNLTYEIYLKEDNFITVKKCAMKDYDIEKIEDYELNFKEENINIVKNYLMSLINAKDTNIGYISATLRKDEEFIVDSIVQNNEDLLLDFKNKVKLQYTITFSGINCLTPTLYLYDDNTYEYYYTFNLDDEKNIPKSGEYNFDINSITGKKELSQNGIAYIITNNQTGETVFVDIDNEDINKFFYSIDVNLNKCLRQS